VKHLSRIQLDSYFFLSSTPHLSCPRIFSCLAGGASSSPFPFIRPSDPTRLHLPHWRMARSVQTPLFFSPSPILLAGISSPRCLFNIVSLPFSDRVLGFSQDWGCISAFPFSDRSPDHNHTSRNVLRRPTRRISHNPPSPIWLQRLPSHAYRTIRVSVPILPLVALLDVVSTGCTSVA